jgi:hypothetical protein
MTSSKLAPMKPNRLYYILILLVVEKIIQHVFVTSAFYFNWKDIASTVAISPTFLMIAGAIVAVLFGVALWGMLTRRAWTLKLLIALALFDIVGEFAAQGMICIVVNVSFIVATLLLILSIVYWRQLNKPESHLAGS